MYNKNNLLVREKFKKLEHTGINEKTNISTFDHKICVY
jgi:hypothetical protein